MSEFEDYVRERIDDALRARSRWFVDCMLCGEPYRVHDADGRCTRDPATYAKPTGIIARAQGTDR